MATYTVQPIVATLTAGLTPSYTAAASTDQFANDGRTFLHVKNAGGSADVVTINSQVACSQGVDHDLVISVTNAQERMIGPFPVDRFNDANGFVQVAHSFLTSVTVGAFRLP